MTLQLRQIEIPVQSSLRSQHQLTNENGIKMAKLDLSEKQIAFLADSGINFDFAEMSEDDLVDLEEQAGDLLVLSGLDESHDDNDIGK